VKLGSVLRRFAAAWTSAQVQQLTGPVQLGGVPHLAGVVAPLGAAWIFSYITRSGRYVHF